MDITEPTTQPALQAALDRVRAERDQLRALCQQARSMMAVFEGPDHVCTYANPSFQAQFASRPLVGRTVRDVLPEWSLLEVLDTAYRTGRPYQESERPSLVLHPQTGAMDDRVFDVVIEPTVAPDGTVAGVIAYALDVTARVQARRAAEAEESRYHQLADSLPQIVWTAQPDGTRDYFNARTTDVTGIPYERLVTGGWVDFLHPDDVTPSRDLWQGNIRTGLPHENRLRIKRAQDGTYRWHLGRALPVRDDDGRVVKWFGTATDIHDQVEAELALQEANEELSSQTEELVAQQEELERQQEELESQQEELNGLYVELQAHTEKVEAEVQRRTLELRHANEELDRQRSLLEAVLNNLPGGVGYCDRDLNVRLVNQAFADQIRQPVDAIVDRHASELLPHIYDQLVPPVRHVLATGQIFQRTGVPVRGSQPPRFLDYLIAPVRDRKGEIQGALSLAMDVSDRVRLELEVAERNKEIDRQKRLIERIIAHAPAGISFLDRDLIIRWFNPMALGPNVKEAEAYLNRHVLAEASDEAKARFEPILRRVLETGEPYRQEGFKRTTAGPEGPVTTYWDFSYVPVFGDDAEVEGLLTFALETTSRVEKERLQAEQIEQLRQVDAIKDDFLSVVSHELRTPLNFIMGFASILDDEVVGPLNEQQHQFAEKILGGADRMLFLVDDLLDYAKIQAGKFRLSRKPCAIAPIVNEVLETMRPLASQRGLELDASIDVSVPITLDGPRIVQVLTNLVSNAIKFTDQGSITVKSRLEGARLVTEVTDTGCGIPDEDVPKLFKRFQQLDMTSTRKVGGVGLGLSITKALVEAHGGRIEVESTVGEGTTFRFSLPLESVDA